MALCAGLATGLGVMASAAEAAPFAYVTNVGSNNVSVIDTATNIVVATIPVAGVGGAGVGGVAVTPDGKYAYVTGYIGPGSASVSVIDTTTNTVVATVNQIAPLAVAITPDGKHAYVTNGDGTVSVIDTPTNLVVATVGKVPGAGDVLFAVAVVNRPGFAGGPNS